MADPDCPHLATCPMYPLLTLAGTLKVWQTRYCKATFTECARYKMTLAGRQVPNNLMPNGAYLKQAFKPPQVE